MLKREDLANPADLDKLILQRPISNEINLPDAEITVEEFSYSYRKSEEHWSPDSHFTSTDGSSHGFSFYSYSPWKEMSWSQAHLADDSEAGRETAIRDFERYEGTATDRDSGAVQIRESKTVRTVRGEYFESIEEVTEVFYVSKRTIEEYKLFIAYMTASKSRKLSRRKCDLRMKLKRLQLLKKVLELRRLHLYLMKLLLIRSGLDSKHSLSNSSLSTTHIRTLDNLILFYSMANKSWSRRV